MTFGGFIGATLPTYLALLAGLLNNEDLFANTSVDDDEDDVIWETTFILEK